MIYSRVIEYSGRILLPQNDEIRMYVITFGVCRELYGER